MMAGLSGGGEHNVGVYIYMFSFTPYAYVTQALGFGWFFPPRSVVKAIVYQALAWVAVGALLDFFVAPVLKTDSPR
ncbi:MAG TPA: hypothetical protein VIU34_35715 [Steroidobacter sp.]